MANYRIRTLESGLPKYRSTGSEVFDFTSVRIGASVLEIKETTGHFDFSAKKLTNIAAAVGAGEAVEYAQLNTALALYIPLTQKGAANGVATLDGAGKIPVAQLPSAVMTYEGVWNASTNSPSLADGVGDTGQVYRVGTAGTQNLGSGNISFSVGDYVIYNGTIWEKSDTTDAVASVNGFTGIVVLTTTDIAEGTNLYYTAARFNTAFAAKTTTDLAEGTNLYFTDARARTAVVDDAIVDGVTNKAPSQNAVFDALALKADASSVQASYVALVNDNAGTITIRQLVYIKANGAVDLAQANAAGTSNGTLGIVFDATIATTASGNIQVNRGLRVSGFTGLTPGAPMYLSPSSAGGYTQTAPSTVGQFLVKIGYAVSATVMVFDPQEAIEIAS